MRFACDECLAGPARMEGRLCVTETLPFSQVDAFAERPYRGNPAGVVFDADGLTEQQMQLIAREVNASETAFISRIGDLHRLPQLRWFTPKQEVNFCGHATLAAAHALREAGHVRRSLSEPASRHVFETAAGRLSLVPEMLPEPGQPVLWWLEVPAPQLQPEKSDPIRLCELLSLHEEDLDPSFPPLRTRDGDVLLVVRGWSRLMELTPDFSALQRWCQRVGIRGVSVATTETLSDSIDVQSRFFAPACGVDEDPVTGSVHGPLAINLVINGVVGSSRGHSGLMCLQGKPGDRTGLVRALVVTGPEGYRAKIAGLCHTTLSGTVLIPPTE